jgi:hypothetical protein
MLYVCMHGCIYLQAHIQTHTNSNLLYDKSVACSVQSHADCAIQACDINWTSSRASYNRIRWQPLVIETLPVVDPHWLTTFYYLTICLSLSFSLSYYLSNKVTNLGPQDYSQRTERGRATTTTKDEEDFSNTYSATLGAEVEKEFTVKRFII